MKTQNMLRYVSLVFAVGFLASCGNPFHDAMTAKDLNKGLVTLHISDGNAGARTLLPSDPVFSRYVLRFTGEGKEGVTLSSVDKTAAVELEGGVWTVTVEGYVTLQGKDYLAAKGEQTIHVIPGKPVSVSVSIRANNTGEAGIFSYDIHLLLDTESLSKALLVFESLDSNNQDNREIDLKEEGAETGTFTVKPGFYLVKVLLENVYQTAGKTEVVHIYTGMETKADYTFRADDLTRIIPLKGTAQATTHGADQKKIALFVYSDTIYEDLIVSTEVALADNGAWKTAIPADTYERVYFKLRIEDETGFSFVTPAGYEAIPEIGKTGIAISITIPEPQMTSFSVTAEEAGLDSDLTGTIDENQSTITLATQKWIENIAALKTSFASNGMVTVNAAEQESGVTGQDFRRDIVYTVTTEDNATRDYTVVFESPQATGLPVIKIDTKDNAAITSKETYVKTNIAILDPNNGDYSFEHAGYKDEIRGRGNNTWGLPKKPYRIKLDKKQSLFGLESAKSWVLLAGYNDLTLLENVIAFELGRRFDFPFTNHYEHIELFLNGSYQGTYLLTEQVQVGKGRVDIDEDDGFLVELDFYYDEDPKFKTNIVELPIMIKSPEDLNNPSGYDFVKDAINQLEEAMFAGNFPESGYRDLINMNTFVDYMLIQDIVLNFEPQVPASVYMYKDVGDLINMGPLWDFDNGFGGGVTSIRIPWHPNRLNWYGGDKFFQRFFDDPYFLTEYKKRWNAMYSSLISIPAFIDGMAVKLSKSYILEQQRWGTNHAAAVPQLKAWWAARIAYLNTEINKY